MTHFLVDFNHRKLVQVQLECQSGSIAGLLRHVDGPAVFIAETSGNRLHLLILRVGVHAKVVDALVVGLTDEVREEVVAEVLATKAGANGNPVNGGVGVLVVLPLTVFDMHIAGFIPNDHRGGSSHLTIDDQQPTLLAVYVSFQRRGIRIAILPLRTPSGL